MFNLINNSVLLVLNINGVSFKGYPSRHSNRGTAPDQCLLGLSFQLNFEYISIENQNKVQELVNKFSTKTLDWRHWQSVPPSISARTDIPSRPPDPSGKHRPRTLKLYFTHNFFRSDSRLNKKSSYL